MSNKKATKRALLTSVMALAMCVVMLVGTTFAWFTDTAKTGVNQIKAGKLDIELVKEDGAALGENDALKWVKPEGHEEDTVLWEPNCTYELAGFQVKNAGNLAVKYKVVLNATNISVAEDGKSLLDVIDWTVKVDGVEKQTVTGNLKDGVVILNDVKLLPEKLSGVITVTGHMDENAGNDYQDMFIDGFGITVYATQAAVEYDSYDNQYDKYAQYGERTVMDGESLSTAGSGNTNTANITYSFPTKIYDNGFFAQHFGVNSTFDGNGATFPSFQLNGAYVPTDKQESTLVVSNINVEGDLIVTAAGNNVIINNCTAKHISVLGLEDGVSVTIDNCKITGTPVGQTSGNNENGIYITGVKDAEVKVNILNSSISGIASHGISVNGSGAAFTFDIEGNNFELYGLNTAKSNRAAFKIWGDKTLAPNNTDEINAAANALAASVEKNNTFGENLGTNCVVADFYGKTVPFTNN